MAAARDAVAPYADKPDVESREKRGGRQVRRLLGWLAGRVMLSLTEGRSARVWT